MELNGKSQMKALLCLLSAGAALWTLAGCQTHAYLPPELADEPKEGLARVTLRGYYWQVDGQEVGAELYDTLLYLRPGEHTFRVTGWRKKRVGEDALYVYYKKEDVSESETFDLQPGKKYYVNYQDSTGIDIFEL